MICIMTDSPLRGAVRTDYFHIPGQGVCVCVSHITPDNKPHAQ